MLDTNSLDKIWIMCHEALIDWHASQANAIREFLEKKGAKK